MLLSWIDSISTALIGTLLDVLPIAVIMVFFQVVVLRQPIPHFKRVMIGFVWNSIVVGLSNVRHRRMNCDDSVRSG